VNGDGKVTIDDVSLLIDSVLSGITPAGNGDVDGNGNINIDDISALIDMLLNE
jgi:hypothetical protein